MGGAARTQRVDELLADDGARLLPPPPAHGAPLPPAPAERAARSGSSPRSRSAAPRAWTRLFGELTSSIEVELEEHGRRSTSRSHASPPRRARCGARAAAAVTRALRTGAAHARVHLQHAARRQGDRRPPAPYPHWLAARNLANEASDESVEALVSAVAGRYELARRWYRLKATLLGIDRLADYDRMAPLATDEEHVEWPVARDLVLDAYGSFSPTLGALAQRFFDERWIDAPPGHGKQRRRVLRLHRAVGAPLRAAQLHRAPPRRAGARPRARATACTRRLRAPQGIFHQGTPLTLAETASVFGEALTFGRLLDASPTPGGAPRAAGRGHRGLDRDRLPPGRDEPLRAARAHRAPRGRRALGRALRRDCGRRRRRSCFGDSVEVTDDYRSWWSYIPHFINTPGLRLRLRLRPAARAVGL